MNQELLLAATLFSFVSSITPGPNNTMLLASGVNFGLRRSLGHLSGVCLGFGFMLASVGLGLHQVLQTYPLILETLRYLGAAYLLWLAWKLATARPAPTNESATPALHASVARPMRFWSAVAFQWVNPKAWVMAMTAMTTYLPAHAAAGEVLLLAGLFFLVNVPCVGSWLAFGNAMRRLLQDPLRLRIFNITMAIGLIFSMVPLLSH